MGLSYPRFNPVRDPARSDSPRESEGSSIELEHDDVALQTAEERARQRHAEFLARLANTPPRTFFASLVAENPWVLSLELPLFAGTLRSPRTPRSTVPAAQPFHTVKSAVNIHKSSLRLEPIDRQDGKRLFRLHFAFDATESCTVRTYAGVKEVLQLVEVDPDKDEHDDAVLPSFVPDRGSSEVEFEGGFAQAYRQPEGEYLDAAFFGEALEADVDIGYYPLVIAIQPVSRAAASLSDAPPTPCVAAQLTYASLSMGEDGAMCIKPVKQKIVFKDRSYLVQDVFGLESEAKDSGRECVICLTEPRDIVLLPCLHMCLCLACADTFRQQSSACPICRAHVRSMVEVRRQGWIPRTPAGAADTSSDESDDGDADESPLTRMRRPESERQLLPETRT